VNPAAVRIQKKTEAENTHSSRSGNRINSSRRSLQEDIFDIGGMEDSSISELPKGTITTRQSGNPLIQQTLPVAFRVGLSILPTTDRNVLLAGLETTLENYLRVRYNNLIGLQAAVFGSTTASSINLQKVDLDLTLTQDDNTSKRNRKRNLLRRNLQEQSSSADQVEIEGVGGINYSLQVDGSNPTPDEVKATWSAVFEEELMTQAQIEEVVGNTGFDSILRVDEVTVLNPSEVADDTTSSTTTGGGTAQSQENDNAAGSESATASSSEENNEEPLTRPTTLSIVFGFLLVAIATIGLIAYGYIFYKKRQKRLRKKRMMQETISYPAASVVGRPASSAAGASTSFSSTGNTVRQNNISGSRDGIDTSLTSTSGLPPTPVLPMNPMIISRADDDDEEYSQETSYKGLEGSLGSEDPSDSFAKELQLAASLDQQAWDEFQRRKEVMDRNRKQPEANRGLNSAQEEMKGSSPPPTPPAPDEQDVSIEADLAGKINFVRSFPYGDEPDGDDRGKDVVPWEPYGSPLPPSPNVSGIAEEKKDDISPTSFFAQKLQTIEADMARVNNSSTQDRQFEPEGANAVAESDVVSEVEELTKYVRRYERNRDRRVQRESKLKALRGGGFSIGMDGRVISNSDPVDHADVGITNSHSSSLSPPSVPLHEKADPLGKYNRQTSRMIVDEDRAYISDTEGSEDGPHEEPGSEHSRRLGISPFRASAPDHRYLSTTRSLSSNKSRLSDLRKTEAIIDTSKSDVNPTYDRDQMRAAMRAVPQMQPATITESGHFARVNVNGTSPNKATTTSPRVKETKNKRFNKLRGLFEQRTNEQPEPIYPPTEHWQYGLRKNDTN